MLDKDNNNVGYLTGRLVAVAEKIQTGVESGDTIRTKYMRSASVTPATVMSTILRLSSIHMEKLSPERKRFYNIKKQEIVDKLPADGFPAQFDLADQGRFFVGYYHQMLDLYTKTENKQ